jgi:monoamine oxidase
MTGTPTLVAPTVDDLRPDGGPTKRVIVVGAGMAGLSAAYQLRKAGHEVVVLEARPRPGGRVRTVREPFSDGLYAEAGAIFIPTNHDYLMKYVELAKVDLDPTLPRDIGNFYFLADQLVLLNDGQNGRWPLPLTEEEHALGPEGIKARYFGDLFDRVGDIASPDWPPPVLHEYDSRTALELMAERGASPAAQELLRVAFMARVGDGGRSLSALYMLRFFGDALERSHAGTWMTIRGGNDRLPAAVAALLGDAIRYAAPVTRIEHDADGVTAHFVQAGRAESCRADHLVSAVPYGCLRRVDIHPRLSDAKTAVIEGVEQTSVTHVYVQTRSRFWTARSDLGTMGATDLPIGLVRDATFNQPGTRGIIDCFAAGEHAVELNGMDPETRDRYVLEHLDRVMPGAREHAETSAVWSWDAEEWSRGDYAWFRPGDLTRFAPDLARPEGRLHFAGDQTSPWPAWQQGAIHSGHRAAREVHESAG